MVNFEEMDIINFVMDLVVFWYIKDIDMGIMMLFLVFYDFGLNFYFYLNDWVGLFYFGWGLVNDFLEYRWVLMLLCDLIVVYNRCWLVLFDVFNFVVC